MILITGITGKSGQYLFNEIINNSELISDKHFRLIIRNSLVADTFRSDKVLIEKYIGDLNNIDFIDEAMKDVDIVINIAGIYYSENIVKSAMKNKVKWIILVHTTGIFSKYKYASKEYKRIENNIINQLKNTNIDLTIVRPTMIYGNLNDKNISTFIRMVDKLIIFPVVDGGKYLLQPVCAKDLGLAYFSILLNHHVTRNKEYTLSGKEPIYLIDLLKIIADYLGKKRIFISIPYFFAYCLACILYFSTFGKIDIREKTQRLVEDRAFSHDLASKDFNYNPVDFNEGVKEEINDYINKKNRKL